MAKERRISASRPQDPSAAIARIPAGAEQRTGEDEPDVRLPGPLTGMVTDHADPEGAGRVEVELRHALLGDKPVRRWCRTVGPGAGDGRGVAFRPEIGDEVLVAFVEADAAQPIVLGGLWSATEVPPVAAQTDNDEKAIVTRSGLRIDFDDDNSAVTVHTDGGRRLTLSDGDARCVVEDALGNVIVLDGDGISVTAAGDLRLAASGSISLDGATLSTTAPTAEFPGTVTANTVTAQLINGAAYTPGAGNVV